jgi:hypothetical protein
VILGAPAHDDAMAPPPGYTSVDEVPDELLDPHPPIDDEGDDSRLVASDATGGITDEPHLSTRVFTLSTAAPFPAPARARIVPLRRPLKRGMRGKDVIATKRALSHAGYLRWPKRWTLLAGPFWQQAVKSFQKKHKITVDGRYGLETHRKLVTLGHFDKYGALLMASAPSPNKNDARNRLEAIALYGYHWRDRINYTQSSARMSIVRHRYGFPWFQFATLLWEDCSSFVTGVYYSAKLPDPNHLGYNGWGFTGTLAQHGIQTVNVKHGDLAFYGTVPFRHVTIHVGYAGRVVSHGSNAGPLLLSSARYRSDYHYSRSYLP